MSDAITNIVGNGLPPPTNSPAVVVSKLPIINLVIMFLVAVGLHVGIALYLKQTQKEIKELGETPELAQRLKVLKFLFRWYPACAVVVLVLFLYF